MDISDVLNGVVFVTLTVMALAWTYVRGVMAGTRQTIMSRSAELHDMMEKDIHSIKTKEEKKKRIELYRSMLKHYKPLSDDPERTLTPFNGAKDD